MNADFARHLVDMVKWVQHAVPFKLNIVPQDHIEMCLCCKIGDTAYLPVET